MNIISKIAPFLLLGNLLMATNITIETKEVMDKFCKKVPNQDYQFCMEVKSKYPIISSSEKVLEENMNRAVEKEFFKKGYAKKYVLENFEDYGPMGHEDTLKIKVLSQFSKSFTLEVDSFAYLGGRHGRGAIKLVNYDAKTGKEIKLDALFIKGYKQKLTDIAEKVYRKKNHIKDSDSFFDKDGSWHNGKFELSKEIGIGKEGLHLEYAHEEVQPYSAGTISLVVNYELLKDIINPNAYLAFVEKKR